MDICLNTEMAESTEVWPYLRTGAVKARVFTFETLIVKSKPTHSKLRDLYCLSSLCSKLMLQPYKVYNRNACKPPIPMLHGVRKVSIADFKPYLLIISFWAATGKSATGKSSGFTTQPSKWRWRCDLRAIRSFDDTLKLGLLYIFL